ncbi:unnamed protein product [Adineta steineri]|uniref:Peptidase S1 domain-containing protein n=1 Tax=Adineta steineri TaxID=433720 RepID=A0A815E2F4_9BILA|nr:unnamed protein product [Adineta steineri]CAF3674139.1 unnamed protein product [Adineta steineri]
MNQSVYLFFILISSIFAATTSYSTIQTSIVIDTTSLITQISEVSPVPLPTSLNDKLDYHIYQTRLLTDIAEENRVALKRLTIMMSHLLDNNTKATINYTVDVEKQHIEPMLHVDNVVRTDDHILLLSYNVDADPDQYPWVVALIRDDRNRCGGILIDNQHVLTSAHCIGIRYTVVRLGSHLYDQGEEVKPSFYCVHYSYSSANYYRNNLAIIRLAKPVSVLQPPNRVSTIDICNSTNIRNAAVSSYTVDLLMVGWGLNYNGFPQNALQHARVALTDTLRACKSVAGSGLFQHTNSTNHWCVLAVASSSNTKNCEETELSTYVKAASPDYTDWFKNVLDRNKSFDDLRTAQKCKPHTLAQQLCLRASC